MPSFAVKSITEFIMQQGVTLTAEHMRSEDTFRKPCQSNATLMHCCLTSEGALRKQCHANAYVDLVY
ncbi:hypothetical protein EUGRSUZ_D01051 [Eucalyptus grandis]|uniref:Uncharacterized protein n=1 Tax=Eucalyptus grandis TaxID=71139 RepID=A0A059CEK8_EUCGR|nr:hypothetical protein EUGRSUZ_D01051 [Eucalyptus grandis]